MSAKTSLGKELLLTKPCSVKPGRQASLAEPFLTGSGSTLPRPIQISAYPFSSAVQSTSPQLFYSTHNLVFDFPKSISKICQQIVVELEKERNHISHLGALGPQYYLCFGRGCQSQVRAKSLVKIWVKSQWFHSSPSLAFLVIEGCLGHGYETHLWLPYFIPNPVSANSSAVSSHMLWWGNKTLLSAQYSHQDSWPKLQPINIAPRVLAGGSPSSDDIKHTVNVN